MPTVSKSSIEKLSEQINQIATRLDPSASRELILVADHELVELAPDTWRDRLLQKHYELRPFDRGAGKITIVISTVPRGDDFPAGSRDMASRVLLKELRAPKQIEHKPQ